MANWYDNMTEKEATETMYKALSIEERVEYDYTDIVMIEEFNEEMRREALNIFPPDF